VPAVTLTGPTTLGTRTPTNKLCKLHDAGGHPGVAGTLYICRGCKRPVLEVSQYGHSKEAQHEVHVPPLQDS
jgi:predicted Fe-S protein YdhL (DUF1289 family)